MANDEVIHILEKIPLFRKWEMSRIRVLSRVVERKVYSKGQPSENLLFIISGRVDIVPSLKTKSMVLATLQMLECCGETSIMNQRIRPDCPLSAKFTEDNNVVCATRVELFALFPEQFGLIDEATFRIVIKSFGGKQRWHFLRSNPIRPAGAVVVDGRQEDPAETQQKRALRAAKKVVGGGLGSLSRTALPSADRFVVRSQNDVANSSASTHTSPPKKNNFDDILYPETSLQLTDPKKFFTATATKIKSTSNAAGFFTMGGGSSEKSVSGNKSMSELDDCSLASQSTSQTRRQLRDFAVSAPTRMYDHDSTNRLWFLQGTSALPARRRMRGHGTYRMVTPMMDEPPQPSSSSVTSTSSFRSMSAGPSVHSGVHSVGPPTSPRWSKNLES